MPTKLFLWMATVASLLTLENRFPFFKFPISTYTHTITNLSLGLVNAIASSLFILLATKYTIIGQSFTGVISTVDSPLIGIVISFLILDLYMYAWHRLMHTFPLAWRFHRVHHTDLYMNVSTAYRFHAIEVIVSSIPKLGLIWWLGISTQQVLIYELVFTVIVALHHSNVAIPKHLDKMLAYLIVTPNYHRIHHSQIVTETNSNYGSVLTGWDWIFQSEHHRSDISKIELGVDDETRELTFWELIRLPFVR